ncbi:MAG: cytochrome c oxidase assembly protein [Bryobacteraceae bacterium]
MTWRIASVAGGIAVAATAIGSPLAHLDHHLLVAHMVQHLLLMLVAAPLILLGMRSTALPQTPAAVCWLAGSGAVILWRIPPVFDLALKSTFWHEFEHASFFLAGLLFWRPVIGNSGWSAPVYLFLATLPCDALSAFLAFCGHVVYRSYLSAGTGMFGLSALDDQELAGALMWVAVTFFYLIPALVLAARLLSDEHNQAAEIRVA